MSNTPAPNVLTDALSTNWYIFFTIALSVLAFINGLMLLRSYLRDRPILEVNPIHPDVYHWFFPLPDGIINSIPTRKFGFLTYIDIKNKGIRDVALDEWRLTIKTRGGKSVELKPISIPEPQIQLGESKNIKTWPVLGQPGLYHKSDTMVRSGSSIAGFAYYVAEFYGSDDWNPMIKDKKTSARLKVHGIFGNTAYAKILFSEITLKKACEFIPDIDKIY